MLTFLRFCTVLLVTPFSFPFPSLDVIEKGYQVYMLTF